MASICCFGLTFSSFPLHLPVHGGNGCRWNEVKEGETWFFICSFGSVGEECLLYCCIRIGCR